MSIAYDIRNLKTSADLEQKRAEFFKLLRLQQKLNKDYEEAVLGKAKSQQLGITPVAPEKKSLAETLADITTQRQMLDKNLRTIMNVDEAQKLLTRLTDAEIVDVNKNFKGIEKALQGKTLLDNTYVYQIIRRYLAQQGTLDTDPATAGIDLNNRELKSFLNNIIASGANPTSIKNQLDNLANQFGTTRTVLEDLVDELKKGPTGGIPGAGPISGPAVAPIARTPSVNDQAIADEIYTLMKILKNKDFDTFYGKTTYPGDIDVGQAAELSAFLDRVIDGAIVDGIQYNEEDRGDILDLLMRKLVEDEKKETKDQIFKKGIRDSYGDKFVETLQKLPQPAPLPSSQFSELSMSSLPSPTIPTSFPIDAFDDNKIKKLQEEASKDDVNKLKAALAEALGDNYKEKKIREQFISTKIDTRKIKDLQEYLNKVIEVTLQNRASAPSIVTPPTTTTGSGIHMKGGMMARYGHSTLVKPRARRIVGMGIAKNQTTYEKFGRYMLYMPALRKNILNLKFPSFINIPTLPKKEISDDLKEFIMDLLENKKMNKRLYDRLSSDDRAYFNKIASKSQIDETLDISDEVGRQERDELKRFELVKGIVMAGSNAPEVLQELKDFLLKFSQEGKIHPHKVNEILYDLMAVS